MIFAKIQVHPKYEIWGWYIYIYVYIIDSFVMCTLLWLTPLLVMADSYIHMHMACTAGKWSRMPSRWLTSRASQAAVTNPSPRRTSQTRMALPKMVRAQSHAKTSVEISQVERHPQRGSRANRPHHLRKLREWQGRLERSQSAAPAMPEWPHRDQVQSVLYQ